MLILRQNVALENFTDIQKKLADVDGDGSITLADALEVLRAGLGLATTGNIGEKYEVMTTTSSGGLILAL